MGIAQSLPSKIGIEPPEGRRTYRDVLDFTASPLATRSLIMSDVGLASGFQSVFVDASNSPAAVTLRFDGSGQAIVIPAYSQAIFPVLQFGPNANFTAVCAGNLAIPVVFTNFALDPMIWNSAGSTITGVVNIIGSVVTAPTILALSDRSGVIAAAGVSQQLAAANGARKYLLIANPGSVAGQNIANLESLFINFTANAGVDDGVSIELFPGASYSFGSVITSEKVTVNAATVGHRFIAREG